MSTASFLHRAMKGIVPLFCAALLVNCGGGSSDSAPAGQAPTITTQPTAQSVTVGAKATFTAAATGTPAPEYQWEKNGNHIAGATGASLEIPNVPLTDDGSIYDVIVRNASGSVTSTKVALHVQNTPGNFLVKFVLASTKAGFLSGTWIQSVAPGGNASPVTVTATAGSQFLGWACSDGSTTATSTVTPTNVQSDLTYTANFSGSNVGCQAVDIPGIDATGASVKMSDFAGSVIVLDVSTQWCHYCQQDAPMLEALYNSYKSQGLKVITVLSEDNAGFQANLAVVQSWASTYGLTFPVMNDTSNSSPASGVAESVYVSNEAAGGFPTFAVIDKNFVVQYIMGGYDPTAVQAKVEELLAK